MSSLHVNTLTLIALSPFVRYGPIDDGPVESLVSNHVSKVSQVSALTVCYKSWLLKADPSQNLGISGMRRQLTLRTRLYAFI